MVKESLQYLVDKFNEHSKHLSSLFTSITEDAKLTTGGFMNILWKRFHHISLSRIDLFKLKHELCGVGVNFDRNVEYNGVITVLIKH